MREVDARNVPGARAPTCLICESPDVIRRLWSYPSDWQMLGDDDLLRICDRT
jgi:hypothetical protein